MEFQMPDDVSKTLTRPTQLAYIRRLNKLAAAGFDTPAKLLKQPFIQTETDNLSN